MIHEINKTLYEVYYTYRRKRIVPTFVLTD